MYNKGLNLKRLVSPLGSMQIINAFGRNLYAPKQATPWKDYASQSTLIFQLDCVKNGIKKKNEYTTPDGSKYRTIDGYIYAIKE